MLFIKRYRTLKKRFALSGGLAALLSFTAAASAQDGPPAAIDLASHRAVYTLSLDHAGAGSNVTDITGSLVFEFKGSSCAGYTLNTRLTTKIFDRDGKATTQDIRSDTFEQGDGAKFRFLNTQYANDKLIETSKGVARHSPSPKESIAVDLEKPKRGSTTLAGPVLFPTQHSLAILKAAQTGQMRFNADLYDGSEKGVKVYETTTVIGSQLKPDNDLILAQMKDAEGLKDLPSWPVLVSYYDRGETKDGVPAYEISFRMFSNGVSQKLRMDYGTFSLSGELTSIEFLTPKPCREGRTH